MVDRTEYRATTDIRGHTVVEANLPCINGLSAWVMVADLGKSQPEDEMFSGLDREGIAQRIVAALRRTIQQKPEPVAPSRVGEDGWRKLAESQAALLALQEVPREPVATFRYEVQPDGESTYDVWLSDGMFAIKTPGDYPLYASPSTTQQPSVAAHALNTTPVVDHATQQLVAGSRDIVTLGGGIPGDPSGELTAICKGLVSAVAYGENREVSALFDAPEQAHAFVRYLQRFVGNGVAAAPSTPAREEALRLAGAAGLDPDPEVVGVGGTDGR